MKLGKPLIPILDRNETSEIQIYASAYYSDFYPWKMFDGNVNTHWDSYSDKNPIVSITFKKGPVTVQGLSVVRYAYTGRNEPVEIYYWDLETKSYVLIEQFVMPTGVQNIEKLFKRSVRTNTIKLQFKGSGSDIQITELKLHGVVVFNIIKMDNQYYTIKDNEVQTVSDFVESYEFFLSKGFTADAMTSNITQTLKNMSRSYSILSAMDGE